MQYKCPGCGQVEGVPPGENAVDAMAKFHQKHKHHNHDTPYPFVTGGIVGGGDFDDHPPDGSGQTEAPDGDADDATQAPM